MLFWRLAALVLVAMPVSLRAYDSTTGSLSDAFRDDFGETDYIETPWKENSIALPAAPRQSNLVEIVEVKDLNFRYFLDSESLRLGEDRVSRVSLISRSESGYDNVEYVGVQCADEKIRRYAYLDSRNEWQVYPQRDWAKPQDNVMIALTEHFLCDHLQPRSRPDVLQGLHEIGGDLREVFDY